MPLWRIFHHPSAFTSAQKAALATAITELYTSAPVGLPAFYVNVVFVAVDEDSLFIGGTARRDFVRIAVEQIARSMPDGGTEAGAAARAAWMERINEIVRPFIQDRGLEWENHIYETPFDLWRVNGLAAPRQGTEGEALWLKLNKAVPWDKSNL